MWQDSWWPLLWGSLTSLFLCLSLSIPLSLLSVPHHWVMGELYQRDGHRRTHILLPGNHGNRSRDVTSVTSSCTHHCGAYASVLGLRFSERERGVGVCVAGLCLVSGDCVLDDAVGLMAVVTWKADICSTTGSSLSQFERIGAIFQMKISPLIKLRNS